MTIGLEYLFAYMLLDLWQWYDIIVEFILQLKQVYAVSHFVDFLDWSYWLKIKFDKFFAEWYQYISIKRNHKLEYITVNFFYKL